MEGQGEAKIFMQKLVEVARRFGLERLARIVERVERPQLIVPESTFAKDLASLLRGMQSKEDQKEGEKEVPAGESEEPIEERPTELEYYDVVFMLDGGRRATGHKVLLAARYANFQTFQSTHTSSDIVLSISERCSYLA